MTDVALVTGGDLPHADVDSPPLVAALAALGIEAMVVPWVDPFDWSAVPLAIVRSTWDYVDRVDEFLTWAVEVGHATTLAHPATLLAWNSHKRYLADLQAVGVPVVPTVYVQQGATAAEQREVLHRHPGEVVIKPCVSVGAIGARRAPARSAEAAGHLARLSRGGDVLVQPLVDSVLLDGEVSLIFFGGAFSHAVRKVPPPGDFRVQVAYGGTVVPHEPSADELEVAAVAVAAAPEPTLYARVDLVRLDRRPTVMELELIEPELFLGHDAAAPTRFARRIAAVLEAGSGRDSLIADR